MQQQTLGRPRNNAQKFTQLTPPGNYSFFPGSVLLISTEKDFKTYKSSSICTSRCQKASSIIEKHNDPKVFDLVLGIHCAFLRTHVAAQPQ